MSKETLPVPTLASLAPAASRQALAKLDPRALLRNPVIFATAIVAVMVTVLGLRDLVAGAATAGTALQIAFWLWAAVFIANFAEALAEGRGRARADSLRATKTDTEVKLLAGPGVERTEYKTVSSTTLRKGQFILVEAGDIIPADAEVVEGVASVDESAITGESAPVIRESGGDFSSVTGGTRIVSDWLVLRVVADPGKSFLDRMIALVEGAERQKTPNEIALNILLAGLTLIFLLVVVTLEPFAVFSGISIPLVFLAALFVTLIPTTIGGLLSAIGIAGMDRLARANVVAKSGRAVEAAGDVDVLLLDKTGTITFGNRMADALIPASGVREKDLADAALAASLADDTPEGKSLLELARKLGGAAIKTGIAAEIAFSAQTRLSGVDLEDGTQIRKGAVDAILKHTGARIDTGLAAAVDSIARSGGTPLLGVGRWQGAGRRASEGHHQARRPRPLCRAARHGHPHRDDHRRQPPDRRRHRGRGGGGRFPCGSHARGKARPDPQGTGGRPAGRHVRRRVQRRARAGAGGRGRRDEFRHPSGQGGGEPDRPRQRPDQADRGGSRGQATADLAGRAHDVQPCQ